MNATISRITVAIPEPPLPFLVRAGKIIAQGTCDASKGIWDMKEVIEEFESRDWVKNIVFRKGQKLLYPLCYSAEANKILLSVTMSNDKGDIEHVDFATQHLPFSAEEMEEILTQNK